MEANKEYAEKARELESNLKIEQCKNSALEQSLVAKQEMLDNERERTKDAEQKFSELRILLQNEISGIRNENVDLHSLFQDGDS